MPCSNEQICDRQHSHAVTHEISLPRSLGKPPLSFARCQAAIALVRSSLFAPKPLRGQLLYMDKNHHHRLGNRLGRRNPHIGAKNSALPILAATPFAGRDR